MKYSQKFKSKILTGFALLYVLHGAVFTSRALAQGNEVEGGLEKIKEPFGNATDIAQDRSIYEIIADIIKILLQLSFGIAIIMVIVGGYLYMTSRGNEEQSTKGRKTIISALIGIVIIIMSYVIVSIVSNAAYNPDSLTV